MGEVVEITDYKPHLSGEAKCLACESTWVAVAPTGAVALECPVCYLMKGVFAFMAAPSTAWECSECKNQHWYIAPHGFTCSRCGNGGTYEELFDD